MNKNLKGTTFLCVAMVFLGFFCGSVQGAGLTFAVKLTGGLGHISGGDPNEYLKGQNIRLRFLADYFSCPLEGELQEVHYGLDYEASIILLISPRFGFSIGSGSIQGRRESETNKIRLDRPYGAESRAIDVKMSAVPVNLGVYYAVPLSERIRLSFNGGLGFYFSRTEIAGTLNVELLPAYWDRWDIKVKGNGLGFFGGLGLEYSLARHWAIVLEAFGRYAKIKKLTGDLSESDSTGWASSRHGTLSYYEINVGDGVWYPFIWIKGQIIDPNYRNWRDAMADFSGFCLRAGIKIYF